VAALAVALVAVRAVIPAKVVPVILVLHPVVVVVVVVLVTLAEAAVAVVALVFLALVHQGLRRLHFRVPVGLVAPAETTVTQPPLVAVHPGVLRAEAEVGRAQHLGAVLVAQGVLVLSAQSVLSGLAEPVEPHHSLLQM